MMRFQHSLSGQKPQQLLFLPLSKSLSCTENCILSPQPTLTRQKTSNQHFLASGAAQNVQDVQLRYKIVDMLSVDGFCEDSDNFSLSLLNDELENYKRARLALLGRLQQGLLANRQALQELSGQVMLIESHMKKIGLKLDYLAAGAQVH